MSTKVKNDGWLAPVIFLASLVAFYFGTMPLFDDPDMPWHLATGKLLLETKTLPATDPWSFASGGTTWFLLSWIWNIILGVIESTTGTFSVFIFGVVWCAALMGILTQHLVNRGIDRFAVVPTMLLAIIAMVEFAPARPQLMGYAMTLAFVHILHASRDNDGYGKLLLLPLLMLVWANAHGSFIVGFTILAAYFIESNYAMDKAWRSRLFKISVLCGITAMMNPYNMEIISGAMQTLDSDAKNYLIEWQSFTYGKSVGISAWLVVFILYSNFRNKEIPLADKIISFLWLIGAFLVIRNGAIFVLVSAPYLASCVSVQMRGIRKDLPPSPMISLLEKQPAKRLWALAITAAAAFSIAANALPHESRFQTETNSIFDVIDYVQKHEPNRRFLSDYDFGGQIIYKTGGKIPFFMDSRSNTAYSSKEMQNYLAFWLLQPGWEEKIKSYGINGIIIRSNSLFSQAYENGQYHDRWKLVFAGTAASVYISVP